MFPKTGTLLSRSVFLVLQSVPLIFQEPCWQLASIYEYRAPCSEGLSSTLSSPLFHLRWTRCSSLCFVSYHRYWDQEVLRAKKDAQEPSLMKAVINCYWKSYVVLGIFTFLEVKAFPYAALLFSVCGSVLRWMGPMGGEASSLRSEDKSCLGNMT